MKRVWLLIALLASATNCAAGSMLNEPLVASTGSARSNDGYEAALAAAEAGGFPVVIKDETNAFVRVQSRTSLGLAPTNCVFLDIKAWKGFVDVHIAVPRGLSLEEPRLGRVIGERRELAWAVATRARLIAGEPISSDATDPHRNYPVVGSPSAPNSFWSSP